MSEAPESKSCSICGIDVSGKPRTKDAKGRYVCAECMEKAKQTKGALQNPPKPQTKQAKSAAPAVGDNSFILDMGGKALGAKGGKECPNCARVLAEDSVICIGCGYNANSGKQMQVKVVKAKKSGWFGGGKKK